MLHQLLRPVYRIVIAALLITGFSFYAIHRTNAQDPPQPPQPKPTPAQKDKSKDQKERQGSQRQGSQADQQTLDPNGTISINTDLVLLDVNVTDQSNRPIYDLKKEDFTVFEDKVKQEINEVTREEVPVSIGLVIDTSGSMRAKLQVVSDAAHLLVKQMREKDEAFVCSFKAESELVQEFTSDRRDLDDALNELYSSGGTALLDAIIATADYAQQKAKQRRKALIIITDGLEKNSSVKEREVLDAVREDEAQIYLVGFIDEEDNEKGLFGKSPAKKARELLTRLATDSGSLIQSLFALLATL